MRLQRLAMALERRLRAIDNEIDNSLLGGRPIGRRERWALQEGYVSQKWQSWCGFCRSMLLQSVMGAETMGGTLTTSPYSAHSELELVWISARSAKYQSVTNVQAIAGSHLEPTWGDPSKIGLIATALAMNNEPQLSSGLLSASIEARHLQIVRNATAHINSSNMQSALNLASSYRAGTFEAPSDVIFWEEPISGEFVYRYWSDRMISAANIAAR